LARLDPGFLPLLYDRRHLGVLTFVHPPDGEAVAIFRHKGRLSAVTNLCAHQNGPLGEARVVDGCITCPWHGFQDRLEDGRAPPLYTGRLATYRLRLEGRRVLLDPRPNPARHAGGTGARAAMKPVLP